MEFITGKHLPRRTFIRGAGAAMALPFLDAMVPAGRPWRDPTRLTGSTRLVCIEESMGSAGSNDWGDTQALFAPAQVGRDFEFAPNSQLAPLADFKDYLTIVSDTDCRMAEAYRPEEIGGDHDRSTGVFLTQSHPKQTQGSDLFLGTSLDQLHARRFGRDTALPSLELCLEGIDRGGGCAYNYHCAYTTTLAWASPSQPLPPIREPRAVFERLFGDGGTPEQRRAEMHKNASILDWVLAEMNMMRHKLGPEDQQRLDQYSNNIRELEQRIQRIEAQNASGDEREIPEAPVGVPDSFEEHVKLMFDLKVLAFISDTTRVFSLKLGRDASPRVYPEAGTNTPFHSASHHGGRADRVENFAKLNAYHVSMVPYFLQHLQDYQEGDSNLLDKTMVMYGSAMADSNLHNHIRCPLFLAGGANGMLKGGEHLRAPIGTPMANVYLDLLHRMGLDDLKSFGNSTGTFSV